MTEPDLIKAIQEQCDALKTVLVRKNTDYGASAFNRPALAPDVKPTTAILVRMSDKISRLNNLQGADKPNCEAIEDTILDLAGYAILLLIARQKEQEDKPFD